MYVVPRTSNYVLFSPNIHNLAYVLRRKTGARLVLRLLECALVAQPTQVPESGQEEFDVSD